MRTVIVAGAGGSGVTTVAQGVAHRFASQGGRTLVLSLGSVGGPGGPQKLGDGLWQHSVAPLDWAQSRWSALRPLLQLAPGPWGAVAGLEPLPLPGLAEVALLSSLRDHWEGKWDAIVVDGGDADAALRWITLPELATSVLRSAWPAVARAGLGADVSPGLQLPQRVLEWLHSEAAEMASQLRGRAVSAVLVTGPQSHQLQRVLPAVGALALFESKLTDLVINGYSAHRDRDRELRSRLASALGGVSLHTAAAHRQPVTDPAAFGAEVFPEPPARPGRPHDTARVGRDGDVYTWRWRLPLVAPGSVAAVALGEEMLLTVDQYRRRMLLPSVLRRCTPLESVMSGGTLELRFAPDPSQWPVSEEDL